MVVDMLSRYRLIMIVKASTFTASTQSLGLQGTKSCVKHLVMVHCI